MTAPSTPSLTLPCVLDGRYECRQRIGAGGMGEVYRATHLGLERDVAVKVLTTNPADPAQAARVRERFRREAVALSRLRHPNTVQVIDFGFTEDARPYIVTELLTGETLDQVLSEGPMDPERAIHVLAQLCRSLAEAHGQGIVHRDLKPSNVFLLQAFGTRDYVKLIDFGVARIDEADETARARPLTMEGTTLGTPDYMAPEQARGHTPSPATDVYAVGCMLFEMLTGRPPFVGSTALQVMVKHIKRDPPTLAETVPDVPLPAGLEHLMACCLQKDMEQRPKDASIVLELLNEVAKGPAAPRMEEASLDLLDGLVTVPDPPREVAVAAVSARSAPIRRSRPTPHAAAPGAMRKPLSRRRRPRGDREDVPEPARAEPEPPPEIEATQIDARAMDFESSENVPVVSPQVLASEQRTLPQLQFSPPEEPEPPEAEDAPKPWRWPLALAVLAVGIYLATRLF